ncbi:MAG: putative LPS assembly protein LptD [Cellulophaga sp.]
MGTTFFFAQEIPTVLLPIKAVKDTIVLPDIANLIVNDTTISSNKKVDSLPKKKPLLLDKIKYKAKDFVKLNKKEHKIYLYNKAEIYYQGTELTAGTIIMDYVKNEVYAGRIKDSTGTYSQIPYFKQGDNEVRPDSIRFNFDTKKALIWNSRTEQQTDLDQLGSDAMKVYAEITKKENDSVYFLHEGKITTSKDTVNPDYYIRIRKAKFVPKKKIIAGFSNIYIADVPTPIALPFAYFPLTVGRTAGLIMPSYGNDPNKGYFLQNGGYYFPINNHIDLTVTGDLYTNGSYGLRGQSVYAKRYKYRGNINIRYENLVSSQKGFSDYSNSVIYNIQISHSQDPKSSPNSRFSASVNMGSTQYFRSSLNQINSPNTQNNNLSSSISYSKTFPGYPSINMSLTANHNANINTKKVNLTLPTLQASMERIYPFAKRDGLKKGLIQNVNFQYSVRGENKIQTTDEFFLTSKMFDDARVGVGHSIPISTNFKVAKHLSITMGGTYEDVWAIETYQRGYDETTKREIITDTISGFDRYNKYNLSTSIGTTIYGKFEFGDDKKIQALRHVIKPSLSYSYNPSFDQFYDEYLNTTTNELEEYSRFEGTLYGAPSLNKSNTLSFSLNNTLEAKVRSKDSTDTEPRKINILNSFNLRGGYNFEADSLKLSTIGLTASTNILKKKMTVNFSANFDPYTIDNNGRRINTFNINNGGSLLRLVGANASLGYTLNNKTFSKKSDKEEGEKDEDEYVSASGGRTDDLFGKSNNFNDKEEYGNRKKGKEDATENPYYGTKLPWDLRVSYRVTYTNRNRKGNFSNNSLMFSGNIQLSPSWKVGASSGYDFKNNGFVNTQLRFERDLKSFRLNFNWTPFGRYERWNFFIGIKSSILKDLKWESRSRR